MKNNRQFAERVYQFLKEHEHADHDRMEEPICVDCGDWPTSHSPDCKLKKLMDEAQQRAAPTLRHDPL